jgi:Domain of Unknown Function with PDB structure (DUF3857)
MTRLPFAALCAVLLISALPRSAGADEIFTGPTPGWVMEAGQLPVPSDALRAAAVNGQVQLLSDQQVDWDGEEKQTYHRVATLITAPPGLEPAARLQFVYAPGYESLTLTRLVVVRGEKVIDLTETVRAEIATGGASDTTGGPLTAVITVPDLAVGDIVDHAFVRRTLPVMSGANRGGSAALEFDLPTAESRLTLNWPAEWPIYISGWPSHVTFTQNPAQDGIVRHVWTTRDHVPGPVEAMTPVSHAAHVSLAYSAFPDWSAISAALGGHYLESYPLGADWDARLRAIQASTFSDGERVIAALRAVQNDLALIDRPLDAGQAFLARRPEEVTRAGSGDSRDKALLLRSMLDKMGIEAYVALARRVGGHGLDMAQPSPFAFDHAIVKAMVDGAPYWVDPSARHQGGDFYGNAIPDLGYVLPLAGADQQQLEWIDPGYNAAWNRNIEETLRFTPLGAYLTVNTRMTGVAANDMRAQLAEQALATVGAAQLADYAARYPGLRELEPLTHTDEITFNEVTLTARYLIPAPVLAGDLGAAFPFGGASDFMASLPAPGGAPRVAPLDVGPPRSDYLRVTITGAPFAIEMPMPVNLYNDGFSYGFNSYPDGAGGMVLEWSYGTVMRQITPEMAETVLRDAQTLQQSRVFTRNLRGAAGTP